MKRLAMLLVAVVGCGDDRSSRDRADAAVDPADAAIDGSGGGGAFTLTSPMLAEGAAFEAANTCDGANTSPELAWSGDAMNAQSYAVVLTDKNNNLVHWVIYDIPATATGLPANVQKAYAPTNVAGAHQTPSYQANVRGYLGPCPPANDAAHVYEFAVHGVSMATLPGTMMSTTRAQAIALITQYETAKATLTGTYDR